MPEETPCKCPPKAPEIAAGLASLPRQRQTFSNVRGATLRTMRSKAALAAWRAEDADVGLLLVEGSRKRFGRSPDLRGSSRLLFRRPRDLRAAVLRVLRMLARVVASHGERSVRLGAKETPPY